MEIKIFDALNSHKKAVNGSRILFLGVVYKPTIDDVRESPTLEIMDIVANKGAEVTYFDPSISEVITPAGRKFQSINDSEALAPRPSVSQSINHSISLSLLAADCVVLTTNHIAFDDKMIQRHAKLIVDLRNE